MRKLAKQLISKNPSYIEALEEAIKKWRDAPTVEGKGEAMFAIGEIGRQIHNMNKRLEL